MIKITQLEKWVALTKYFRSYKPNFKQIRNANGKLVRFDFNIIAARAWAERLEVDAVVRVMGFKRLQAVLGPRSHMSFNELQAIKAEFFYNLNRAKKTNEQLFFKFRESPTRLLH